MVPQVLQGWLGHLLGSRMALGSCFVGSAAIRAGAWLALPRLPRQPVTHWLYIESSQPTSSPECLDWSAHSECPWRHMDSGKWPSQPLTHMKHKAPKSSVNIPHTKERVANCYMALQSTSSFPSICSSQEDGRALTMHRAVSCL